ncbi:MAG: hypothetical protein WCE90_04175 [Candidatus Zixiibacteriota bacterium]
MSLGIVIKGPEGIVLAAESRVTLSAKPTQGPEIHVNFDNATKLLSFSEPNTTVGVVTYGLAAIGLRTAHSFIPEFEESLSREKKERLTVQEFAKHLSEFFMKQWQTGMPPDYQGPNMTFVVGGFNENEAYGRVFLIDIPKTPEPVEQYQDPGLFGITWGGQREFVDRLIQGYDHRLPEILSKAINPTPEQIPIMKQVLDSLQMQLPLMAMPLQDCVDLAIFFVRTTIAAQKLTVGIRGCGGPVDVAIITRREGLRFVQRKQIIGEIGQGIEDLQTQGKESPWHR